MANMDILKQFGIIPFDTQTLTGALYNYKSPKDKIASFEQSDFLIRLKRGLFVVAPNIQNQPLSKELIANHLYGPSYVSLQTALSFYKLIPERVHTVSSMTIKRSRNRWLPAVNLVIRSATPGKYLHITWPDGTNVDVGFTAKGAGKSQVALAHTRLKDKADADARKVFWGERLTAKRPHALR